MKKRMAILGLMACAAMMTGTAAFAGEMTGAYEQYAEEGVPAEAQEVFDAAMKDFVNGEDYTAVQLVETQLVAGMNYRILAELNSEDAQGELVMLTIYKNLEGSCEVTTEQKVITPEKHDPIIMEESDFMAKVSFSADDVNWDEQTLSFEMYQEALYDMVDMHEMECGSVVEVDGYYITVETIDESEGIRNTEEGSEKVAVLTINKDMGSEAVFVANEGGTWISVGPDDLVLDMKVGEGTYPISDQCVLTDVGESPSEKVEIAFADLQSYLTEDKAAMGSDFYASSTTIEVLGGEIVSIERTYRP